MTPRVTPIDGARFDSNKPFIDFVLEFYAVFTCDYVRVSTGIRAICINTYRFRFSEKINQILLIQMIHAEIYKPNKSCQ